jgi:hypothetical protein
MDFSTRFSINKLQFITQHHHLQVHLFANYTKGEPIMARRSINNPEQTGFQFILEEDSRQEARQRENERKLLAALNSCSAETKASYANMLRQ